MNVPSMLLESWYSKPACTAQLFFASKQNFLKKAALISEVNITLQHITLPQRYLKKGILLSPNMLPQTNNPPKKRYKTCPPETPNPPETACRPRASQERIMMEMHRLKSPAPAAAGRAKFDRDLGGAGRAKGKSLKAKMQKNMLFGGEKDVEFSILCWFL